MLIDRILYPIQSLGPGNRLCIWTVGCSKHCNHCSNSELWKFDEKRNLLLEDLMGAIRGVANKYPVEGITITGGDPFEQKDEMLQLLPLLKEITDDILVYTGFTYSQLLGQLNSNELQIILSTVGVLIDGRYEHDQNYEDCVLKGSRNQNIYYFNDRLKENYEIYLKQGRQLQNVYLNNRAISVGIHNKD